MVLRRDGYLFGVMEKKDAEVDDLAIKTLKNEG